MSARTLFACLLFVTCNLLAAESGVQPKVDAVETGDTLDAVEKVKNTVARILKKPPAQIDTSKLLFEQGADELDIMEVVLDVEDEFKVRIPDSAIGSTPYQIGKVLTVEKLVQVVSGLPKR